jgi:ParB family transcriptional regulator, chromosome partitioning protein
VAELEFDHEASAVMRCVFAKPVPLSKTERKRLHKLQARYDALCEKHPNDDLSADDAAKLDRIAHRTVMGQSHEGSGQRRGASSVPRTTEVQEQRRGQESDVARLVGLAMRSLVSGLGPAKDPTKDADGFAPLSEKLVAELTAYRTSASRNERDVVVQLVRNSSISLCRRRPPQRPAHRSLPKFERGRSSKNGDVRCP